MRIDHIGIATEDSDVLADLYGDLFDASIVHEESVEDVWVTFLDVDGSYFELVEPIETGSTLVRYLEEHGPGLHHVALETDDIEGALNAAREMGIVCIDDEPRSGAWDRDVAFLHPDSTGGVLFEFVAR